MIYLAHTEHLSLDSDGWVFLDGEHVGSIYDPECVPECYDAEFEHLRGEWDDALRCAGEMKHAANDAFYASQNWRR